MLGLLAATLAGCGEAAPANDPCGAAHFAGLVGTSATAFEPPEGLRVRIVGPGDMVTMDHDPARLNLRTDRQGLIQSLDCG
ncbi:I78 family peptidase inhibitor [Maritimibacter sp. 55A14]|uniref:I78 family peptidase inhibitor n=1 Tax=Maritimibacter sp. 55A14 TaxID=2174844 RepID=UPI001304BD69|nr:I78 family peptidase inhibitor [Maritimibacter sp. 55A14]